jgi:hypothetical protein
MSTHGVLVSTYILRTQKYIDTYTYVYIHTYIHTYINAEKSVTTQTYCHSFTATQILDFRFQKQVSFLYFPSTCETVSTHNHVSAKIKMNPRNLKLHCTAVSSVTRRKESCYSVVHYSRQWPPEVSQCIVKFT